MKTRAGLFMDYKTTAAVTHNVPVVVGTVIGIPNVDFAASTETHLVTLECEGVFEIAKTAAEAITQGAKVYITSDGDITATAESNTAAGVAWEAAAADDATIMVKIN